MIYLVRESRAIIKVEMNMIQKKKFFNAIIFSILYLGALLFLFPFFWMNSSSLKGSEDFECQIITSDQSINNSVLNYGLLYLRTKILVFRVNL